MVLRRRFRGLTHNLADHLRQVVDCGAPAPEAFGTLDVSIAIDTSRSTAGPTGSDINGNGQVGAFEHSVYTDPGDSLLAAEVAAVRALLRSTADSDVRYSLVTFAGDFVPPQHNLPKRLVLKVDAVIQSELTRDTAALEAQLDRILEQGSAGATNFSAGMRLVDQTLSGTPPAERPARKRALFISDDPNPLIIAMDRAYRRLDHLMGEAAKKAIHAKIRFNTFGIGEAAETTSPHMLSAIAGATGGTFFAVEDPMALQCALIDSLIAEHGASPAAPSILCSTA